MTNSLPLSGWRIAVPESRELDLFAQMLEERGAAAERCPLVSIYDTPDEAPVQMWLEHFCRGEFDDFIMLTGEGVRRLSGFSERFEIKPAWVDALANVRKISRGPKPGRALRALKLKPDVLADAPTTEGVIATLQRDEMQGRKVAVQLYGEDPNTRLCDFLVGAGAHVFTVAPYLYAPDAEVLEVEALVKKIIAQQIDIMTFTSTPQIVRLFKIAKSMAESKEFSTAMGRMIVASIGPIVDEKLAEFGVTPTITPDGSFFMKPLVRKIMEYVTEHPK